MVYACEIEAKVTKLGTHDGLKVPHCDCDFGCESDVYELSVVNAFKCLADIEW